MAKKDKFIFGLLAGTALGIGAALLLQTAVDKKEKEIEELLEIEKLVKEEKEVK